MLNKLYHKGAEIKSAFLNGVKVFEVFEPLSLFDRGKQGAWYDPSDKTTLFQDAAGTIPVTKDGDPVGLMRDKSGNNNHAQQTVSAARPIYKTDGVLHWLAFDGVDDSFTLTRTYTDYQPHIVFAGRATTFNANNYFIDLRPSTEAYYFYNTSILSIEYLNLILDDIGTSIYSTQNTVSGLQMSLNTTEMQLFKRYSNTEYAEAYFYGWVEDGSPTVDRSNSIKQYLAEKAGVTL